MPSLNSNNISVTVTSEADTTGITKTEDEIKRLGNTNDNAAPKTENLSNKFNDLGGSLRGVGAIIAGYGLMQSFKSLGELAFGGAGQLEQANVSFQNLIGNADTANQVFGELIKYANNTPFQAKDVEESAKQMLAFGENGKDVVHTVKQLGDVASAGGGDLQALSLVTGQVFAQGKLRAQDMYQVINDGGAGLIKIMADNAGGMQNLTAEFENGGIPASQYFAAVNEATAQGGFAFEGADKQAQTFNGRLSTLKDAVQQFAMKLLGVHFDEKTGALLIDKDGLFSKTEKGITAITKALTELAKHKVAIEAIAGAIAGVLLGAIIAVALAIGWVPLAIVGAAAVIGAIIAVIMANWQKWHDVIMAIPLVALIALIVKAIGEIIAHWGDVVKFFKQAWSDIKQWASDAWQGVVSVWQGAGDWFHGVFNGITDWAKRTCDDIVDFFKKLPGRITGAVGNISDRVAGDIKSSFHSLHIPGFATGVHNFGGGLAVVGERGPEVVNLPGGSDVYTNQESRGMMGGATITIQNLVLPGVTDRQSFIASLDQDTLLASRGLTLNRGMR